MPLNDGSHLSGKRWIGCTAAVTCLREAWAGFRNWGCIAGLAIIGCGLSSSGCMPTEFSKAVAWQIEHDRATDAKSQPVDGMPCFRVDEFLLDRLAATNRKPDDDVVRNFPVIAEQCHALALASSKSEIDRLSDHALIEIWRASFRKEPLPPDLRVAIRSRYLEFVENDYKRFTAQLAAADASFMREQAKRIRDRARPSIKERHGSGLLLAMLQTAHPVNPPAARPAVACADLYEPGGVARDDLKSQLDDPKLRAQLERFAPVILQELPTRPRYDPACDRIGTVALAGRPNNIEVRVETQSASVYAYARKAIVREREHLQLVYCYWFPEHPPGKRGDPEAGPIDGATIRITLDSQSRPAIVEVVQNCGCHYRCFAARGLDVAARREFGAPPEQETSALTRSKDSAIKVFALDLFDLPATDHVRPMVISPAGAHLPIGIDFSSAPIAETQIKKRSQYALHPYELLENMPTSFGRASMFGADGLVHNAGRAEGWLLAGTGMLSAGQPRQRGTQLICWDKRSFDDPHLLEESFRLPSGF